MNNDQPAPGATTLVLLPGLMCGDAFWQALQAGTPPSLCCQTVDYGDADSITAMAQVALSAGPPVFVLAGHSMGGRVALEMARLAPTRIQKLILMDTGYLPRAAGEKGDTEKAGRMALVDIAKKDGVRAMCAQWIKGMVHPDRLADKALLEAIIVMFEQKSADRFLRQQTALLNRPDGSLMLAAIKMPCLLVCGRQDSWANVAQHQAMQALAPHAQLAVIEDAGHMALMERPTQTVEAILKYLE